MNNCVECGKELDENHVDPVPLCNDHWHLWWYIGMFVNENGSVIDFNEHTKRYPPSLPEAQEQELKYYNRIKSGERFKNWLEGNEVEVEKE
jgi:hypothetical protein